MELTVQLDPNSRQLDLFGPADGHLRLLRRSLGVSITARQSNLIISGAESNVNQTAEVVDRMQKHLLKHGELTEEDVTGFIQQGATSAGPESGPGRQRLFEEGCRAVHQGPVEVYRDDAPQ